MIIKSADLIYKFLYEEAKAMEKMISDLEGFADICNETELIMTKGGYVPPTRDDDVPCGSSWNLPEINTNPSVPFMASSSESSTGGK